MAVISRKNLTFDIGSAVKSHIQGVVASKQSARLEEERRFQALISSRDLSLDDQLAFRQEQLKKEQESSIRDEKFVTEIQGEIAALKKSSRLERYRQAYFDSYTSWKSGLKPIQAHIDFLESQLSTVNDPELAQQIRTSLSQARVDQREAENAILDNYVEFAQNDKTESVLQDAIDKVRSAKAKAVLGGDAVRASVLDLREQSLKQTLAQSQIELNEHQFDMSRIKSAHPTRMLDLFDQSINGADASVPVVVKGSRYLNAQDYWKNKRNDYIANGYFAKDYEDYYSAWVASTIAQNPELAPDVLRQVSDSTKLLLSRTELKGFENVLKDVAATVMGRGADALAKKYIQQAELDYDFTLAAKKIDALGVATGLDMKVYQNDLLGKLAEVKSPIVQAIISTAADYQSKGYSFSAALSAATENYKSGELFASAVSPKDIATKTPEEVAAGAEKNIAPPTLPAERPAVSEPAAVSGTETKTTEKAFVPQTSSTTTTQTSSTTTVTEPPVTQVAPPVAPKRATLVNPETKERVAVDVDSAESRDYFSKGFVLETKPPTQ